MTQTISRRSAQQKDKTDPLAYKRQEFYIPKDKIYLDGNSLGAMPIRAFEQSKQVLGQQWGQDLISSWNTHDWISLPSKVGEKIARLIGAAPGQTLCCDSISINLFKLLSAALKMQSPRKTILSVEQNFPTDLYMAQGLSALLGEGNCQLKQVNSQHILDNLHHDVAVLMLTQVDFRSGAILDMHQITQAAHRKGILVIWDLAHSAGAIEVELDHCDADFAVGCGYKYLNGGPGAPAFLYVNERHHKRFMQPLYGWMGHAQPFAFETQYQPAWGVSQALTGTPSVIAMSVLDAALEVFEDVNMAQLRAKSQALSSDFLGLMAQFGLDNTFELVSPQSADLRGSQIAFSHPDAYAICQALIAVGVISDFRAPNIIRFGFTPLYTGFEDIFEAVSALHTISTEQTFKDAKFALRNKVT